MKEINIEKEINKKLRDLLDKYGESVIKEAVTRLKNSGHSNTGNLARSLGYEIEESKRELTLVFFGADYLEYVDKGRKPGSKPPPIKPIKKWVKQKGIEPKAAYAIAKKIGKYGIKPTNFWTIASTRRQGYLNKRMEEILKEVVDIEVKKAFE